MGQAQKKLTVVKKEQKEQKERERIELLETRPKPEWFVKEKDQHGRTLLYLRVEITGLLPRRYGPFKNRQKALLFLDNAVDNLIDAIIEIDSTVGKYIANRAFRFGNFNNPIVEDHLASAYRRPRA